MQSAVESHVEISRHCINVFFRSNRIIFWCNVKKYDSDSNTIVTVVIIMLESLNVVRNV